MCTGCNGGSSQSSTSEVSAWDDASAPSMTLTADDGHFGIHDWRTMLLLAVAAVLLGIMLKNKKLV